MSISQNWKKVRFCKKKILQQNVCKNEKFNNHWVNHRRISHLLYGLEAYKLPKLGTQGDKTIFWNLRGLLGGRTRDWTDKNSTRISRIRSLCRKNCMKVFFERLMHLGTYRNVNRKKIKILLKNSFPNYNFVSHFVLIVNKITSKKNLILDIFFTKYSPISFIWLLEVSIKLFPKCQPKTKKCKNKTAQYFEFLLFCRKYFWYRINVDPDY